jgi:release factor glutamine methyltransferase
MTTPVAAGIVRDAISAAVDALAAAGVETPRLDAELLLAEAMGVERASLAADPDGGVSPPAAREFGAMMRRRLRREPVAYVLGRKGFRYLELGVDRRALVPRPETELLVEVALELRPATVLDVGTGSGAVALAIADELPRCSVTATDASPRALELAAENASRLGLAERVRFLEGSVPDGESFELTVANLPYITEADLALLAPEIREWEPREALLGGADGLEAIRGLVPRVGSGVLALEVGEGQAGEVGEMMRRSGFADVETRHDLAGIERVVRGSR